MNHAVAVGYARHLVGWLFACWPTGEGIFPNLLDNINPHNIVGLLDLIQSVETKQHFQKVKLGPRSSWTFAKLRQFFWSYVINFVKNIPEEWEFRKSGYFFISSLVY